MPGASISHWTCNQFFLSSVTSFLYSVNLSLCTGTAVHTFYRDKWDETTDNEFTFCRCTVLLPCAAVAKAGLEQSNAKQEESKSKEMFKTCYCFLLWKGALFPYHKLCCLSEGLFWMFPPLLSQEVDPPQAVRWWWWLQSSVSHCCHPCRQLVFVFPGLLSHITKVYLIFKVPPNKLDLEEPL